MRTTVTLDDDVEGLIRRAMKRSRKSFREALNDGLRRGLGPAKGQSEPPFVLEARDMGLRTGIDPAHVRDMDGEIEVDEFLRKTRQLGARRR